MIYKLYLKHFEERKFVTNMKLKNKFQNLKLIKKSIPQNFEEKIKTFSDSSF